jgi:hypothetical protein
MDIWHWVILAFSWRFESTWKGSEQLDNVFFDILVDVVPGVNS